MGYAEEDFVVLSSGLYGNYSKAKSGTGKWAPSSERDAEYIKLEVHPNPRVYVNKHEADMVLRPYPMT